MARERGSSEWLDAEKEVRVRLKLSQNFGLSEHATKYEDATRQHEPSDVVDETRAALHIEGFRNEFFKDIGVVMFAKDFLRLGRKAMVHSRPDVPTIANRMTHSLHLSYIGEEVARVLGLNVHLTRATALAHDIYHFPMGHPGEDSLSRICDELGLGNIHHAVWGWRVVDYVAHRTGKPKGTGLNLTDQVRAGILLHDGERDENDVFPNPNMNEEMMRQYAEKRRWEKSRTRTFQYNDDGGLNIWRPPNLETVVNRVLDTASYIGNDPFDAIAQGYFDYSDLPQDVLKGLGSNSGAIMGTLLRDLMVHSYDTGAIGYSDEVFALMVKLKHFNRDRIYIPKDKVIAGEKTGNPRCDDNRELLKALGFGEMIKLLFDTLYDDLEAGRNNPYMDAFLDEMDMDKYSANTPEPFMQVCDCIGSMTDQRFFQVADELKAKKTAIRMHGTMQLGFDFANI